MKIERVSIGDLVPYENNAKIHTREQIEQIEKIDEMGAGMYKGQSSSREERHNK